MAETIKRVAKADESMGESIDRTYRYLLSIGEIPYSDAFSDELTIAMSIMIDRTIDRPSFMPSTECREVAALVVLGLVAEGWMIFRPSGAPHSSPTSKDYQCIQNIALAVKEREYQYAE